jgi:signal transduction histidine kinase
VDIVVEREPIDLAALVREGVRSIESLAVAKGLALSVDVPEGSTTVVTDGSKLRHILTNLLGNAIRYTDRGRVSVRARLDAETVMLEIQDTGIGIAPEHLEQIFERFWQVEKSNTNLRGGTGLGLVVTRDLARALGGDVEVQSELARGSLFRVRLPRDSTPR